jgi:MbtH protein
MSSDSSQDNRIYKVVLIGEEKYSLWYADRENPPGWRDVGKSGTKKECLDYINQVWPDMRPPNLRGQTERDALRRRDD